MNRFKRIAAMFMVVLTLFSSFATMTVSAATEGKDTTLDTSYRCTKNSNTGIAGTAPIGDSRYYWHYNADGTALNCPIRFMKEAGTNTPAYCIEVGATFNGYTYDTKALTDSPYWNKLTATAQIGITYATMYGYPVNNYGAANCDAYAATQTIIWEFAKGYRDLNGRTNAYYYNLMIKGSPAENAYNQLSASIVAHNKRPSFAYSTTSTAAKNEIELKYNATNKNWSATLTDANGVLSGYKVTSNGGLTVSKSGNNLTISAASEISGTAQIQLARPLPTTGQALLALYSTTSQNAIIGQLQDPVNSYMTITTEDLFGKVSAEKVDEAGTTLTGIVFGVYADSACTNLITTMTTKDGVATSGDIDVNKYPTVYVKEKSMTDAQGAVYNLNNKVYTVKMVKNSTVSATNGTPLVNTWKDGYVKVIKNNENGASLSGVVFGIYSDSACTKLIEKITTGSDGTAVSSAIDVGTNGSKTVYVREFDMTDEQEAVYSLNTNTYPVTVSAGKTVTANGGKAIVNEWLDGKVKVIKQDETGKPLAGVIFGVYSDSSCNNLITKITTGTDGSGVSSAIDVGATGSKTVYVGEFDMTDEQEGVYVMNTTIYPVTISANKTVTANGGKAIINEWRTGQIKVIKQNEKGDALAGVVFAVYSDSACKNQITTITTGTDGNGVSAALDVGTTGSKTVYVRELSITPEQQKLYTVNKTIFPVTISAGKVVTVNNGKAVVNNWLPGKFSVVKTNSAGALLSGAEFTAFTDEACTDVLKDKEGKDVKISTDKNGYAISTDIYVGKNGSRTIYVKETALNHPDSDIIALNKTVFPVVIKANITSPINDGKPVVNEYKPGKLMLVKENQNGNRLAGVTFSVYTDEACRNLLTTIVTDEHGVGISKEISIDGTGKRTLFVKETQLTDEQKPLYELSNTIYPVIVFPNQTTQVNNGKTIINRWTLGQITLTKVNENGAPLNEVTFAIFEDEECLTPLLGADGKQVMMTTDENGVALSEGIEVNNNGSRKLFVKEHCISEVHGDSYVLDDKTVYPVVITAGTVAKVNKGEPIVNEWSPAKLMLNKVNPAGDGVNGAEFTVYTDKECTNELTDKDGKVVIITDPDGVGISNPIEVGKDGTLTVYLKETAVEDTRVKLTPNVFEVKLVAGEFTEVNNGENIIDEWKPGKLDLYKLNENGDALEGVTFGVFDDAECTSAAMDVTGAAITIVTNKDGYAITNDIYVNEDGSRKLYVKEIDMTDEQDKLYSMNSTAFEVDLKPGETVAVNNGMAIINEWLDATLSLVKQDEDGNLLDGVVFAVYEDEECTVSSSDVEGNDLILTTDENGYAISTPIEMNAHGNRIVFVKEIGMTVSDSDIYDLNNEVWMVELSAGQNTEVNDGENIVNTFKTAPVKIKKSDMTTAEGVPGATIQIFDSNGTMVYEGVTLEDGNTEEIELRVGKYTFVETIAPAGYVLNKTVFEFSVNPDRTVTGDLEVQDKPTEWTITKSDVTTAEPLPGAEITIYDAEGKEVFKDITKEDGTVTAFRLPAGEYTFKETLAPEGYVLNEEIFKFTIDAEGNATGDNTITDRKIKGNIKVIKTDEATGEKLAGAVFGLFSSDGKTKLAEGVTGADGYVVFGYLEYGEYVIKELEAPVGFFMKKTEFKVNITEDGKTYELTVANSREPITNVPKTGDESSSTPLIVCFVLMFMSAATMTGLWLYKSGNGIILWDKTKRGWKMLMRRMACDSGYNN